MNTKTITTTKLLAASILVLSFLLSLATIHVEAAVNDSSINFKKPPGSEAFTLTIRDPDGVQEFSLSPVEQFRYGGLLSGCSKSFVSDNVSFRDPSDFTPVMPAYVVDCQNNTTELEISPPVKGVAKSVAVKKEVPPPPPPPPPQEEKKEGPLSAEDIQYPVPELGNCQSEAECRSYCDNVDHAKECLAFAKKYNLISEQESKEAADKFLNIKNGPGGCNSWSSCENYCNTIDHLDQCIAFAEETGYYSGDELAEARKFQGLVKSGAQFPGGCKDRNTCEIYCSDSSHMEECLNFAEKSGFMPQEEIDEARKFMVLMRQGESPGGCTSKEQCENYCSEDNHIEECIAFAEKAGVMTAEEAEMVRKVGGKGPGGCHSKTQCEAYCEENSEECFNFAKEHGLMSEADLERMSKGMEQFRENLDKMPPEVVQCLEDALGEENFEKIKNGKPIFDRGMEGKMKSCFGQMTADLSQKLSKLPPEAVECIKGAVGEDGLRKLQSGEFGEDLNFESLEGCFEQLQQSLGGGGNFGEGGFSGPGGCKNTEECIEYCTAHQEECEGFGPPGGGSGGFPGGPGGCKSQEECKAYCQEHPDACKGFQPPGGAGGLPGGFQPPSGGGGGFNGPGGCTNKEECIAYCTAHYTDPVCASYIGGGGSTGGEPGPGGCLSQAECKAYCQTHYTDPACVAYGGGLACPEDLKQCPNGSSVGRVAPNCEFAACSILPPPPPPPTQSCAPVPSGLVSWWKGDASASDSADGNSGTLSGGAAIADDGKVGNALKFNAGSVNIGNPANLNFGTGPFSLEAWFHWGGGSSVNNIIRKSNYPSSGPGSGYWLRVGNGTLEFSVGETTKAEGQTIVTAPVSSGVWHHAVGTKDGSGNVKLYVDGESRGTILRQAPNTQSTSDDPFTLGSWRSSTEFFSGLIDEASVYNRALNASEVQTIFNAGSKGKCSGSSQTDFSGPGGCKTPEECTSYCTKNYQDLACKQFMPSGTQSQTSSTPRGLFASIIEFFWRRTSDQ